MPFFNNTENNQLILEKLMQEIEHLNQETANIFNQIGITEQEFEGYIQNRANFTSQEWDNLQSHQKVLEERLEILKSQSVDIEKTKKKRSDLYLCQHWIPVR
ncbi:MAG TPA: hypothetical protein PLC42_00710 [Parachlamydiaceae bacterium]|nr:hypothetical protein [Parachlamydiaceae bacterium]